MKFKKVHKVLAAVLSVLTMMPNCYQLVPEKVKKINNSKSTQKAGGDVGFLSKNTTMTVGERIVKDIVLVLGTLGVGGVIASKCSGTKSPVDKATVEQTDFEMEDITSSNTGSSSTSATTQGEVNIPLLSGVSPLTSPLVDKATVTQTKYGYNIENPIARVVIFSAKDKNGRPALWMMYEIKQPSIFFSLSNIFARSLFKEQLKPISLCSQSSVTEVSTNEFETVELILSTVGVSSAQVGAIMNLIKSATIVPEFAHSPLADVSVKEGDVLHALRAAIAFDFGKFIAASSQCCQQKLKHLKSQALPHTCDLLDANLNLGREKYKQEALPQCKYSMGIPDDTVLKGFMFDIFATNKIGLFSPKGYYDLSCQLHKLESFNYILEDKTRRAAVLEVLRDKDELSSDDAKFAARFSDSTVLYRYLIAKDPDDFIDGIKQEAKKSALPLCQTVLEDAKRKKDDNVTDKNAFQREAYTFNMLLGCNVLKPHKDVRGTYDAISRHITDLSSGITARDILKVQFNRLHKILEETSTAKFKKYEVCDFKDKVKKVVEAIGDVYGTVSAFSTNDDALANYLGQLKTEITGLKKHVEDLLGDYDKLSYSERDSKFYALTSRFNELGSDDKKQSIDLLKRQIDERIKTGADMKYEVNPISKEFGDLYNAFSSSYDKINDDDEEEEDDDDDDDDDD